MVLPMIGAALVLQGGLQKIDLVVGKGPAAKTGDFVTVDYVGTLKSNGKKFDSSLDRHEPFSFPLGAGQVIKGWDLGVVGMKVGGKRKLIIPASLGYGAAGAGADIPPNAALVFEVTLHKIQHVDIKVLKSGTGPAAKSGDVVKIDYTGTLRATGKEFDSSRGKQPIQFQLGGGVIPGFTMGVTGMKLGEKRRIVIPYALAYGEAGRPPVIPPKSDLIFEIELVGLNGAGR